MAHDELEDMLSPDKLRIAHLESVLWKLVHLIPGCAPAQMLVRNLEKFDEDELETVWQAHREPCPNCGGTEQESMQHDGQPRKCKLCTNHNESGGIEP